MTYPKRIRLSRAKGWRLPEGAVVVARPGRWGNPFVVGRDGDTETCVHLHRRLMAGFLEPTARAELETQRRCYRLAQAHLPELEGHHLACWCRPDAWCHADTLLALANGPRPITDDERRILRRIQAQGENGLEVLDWKGKELNTALAKASLIWPIENPGDDTARLTLSTIGMRALEDRRENGTQRHE